MKMAAAGLLMLAALGSAQTTWPGHRGANSEHRAPRLGSIEINRCARQEGTARGDESGETIQVIPTIGLMIGVYILFRCVDTFCANGNRFSGEPGHVIAVVGALVCLLATLYFMVDLVLSPSPTVPGFTR